jgi:hypothetical protein
MRSLGLPVLAALLAVVPCFSFPYLWDDYLFLNNALSFKSIDYLPNPHDAFYRPLSRGAYFQALALFGDSGARLGHVLNALLLLCVVLLFAVLVRRLAGGRAAVLSGTAFALLAPTPFLVGWVSGYQDLLGMLFLLAAFHLQLSGKTAAAVATTALSLLSKETAAVLMPVLAGLDWVLGRKPYRLARRFTAYGALAILWASVHPGIRALAEHGFRSGAIGYVGTGPPAEWIPYVGRYLLTLLNVPTTPVETGWVMGRLIVLPGIALATLLAVALPPRDAGAPAGPGAPLPGRSAVLGALMGVLPLLLTSVLVRGWAPYYVVYPALGSSLLIGVFLARARIAWAAAALVTYLVLGFYARGAVHEAGRPTEYNLSVTGGALRQVAAGFENLRPSIPEGSQVLVAVQAGGLSGIYTHLYYFQALRVWYRDPTLQTMRPDWRRPVPGNEFLFWVSPRLEVFEIDLQNDAPRTNGPRPDRVQYQKTLRYYAQGLAASGETERGLELLLYMPGPRDYADVALDRRLAAMILFHAHRDREAGELLRHVPPVRRDNALDLLAVTLANPGGPHPWDDDAFRAFGVAVDDTAAWRVLMRRSDDPFHAGDGIRFAAKLLRLIPGDPEASAVVRRLSQYSEAATIGGPAPPEGR